jgi:hypothetical protein
MFKYFEIPNAYRRACSHEQQFMQLVKIKVPVAHYLLTRAICCHAIHVLCGAQTLVWYFS